ncbi:hypothetical protein BJ170DRAFT_595731 [Xylariales sp. AK1849]|nr:hypothetical protein BJ170DRAFT_595731 [Xylariales sp. AK1849]
MLLTKIRHAHHLQIGVEEFYHPDVYEELDLDDSPAQTNSQQRQRARPDSETLGTYGSSIMLPTQSNGSQSAKTDRHPAARSQSARIEHVDEIPHVPHPSEGLPSSPAGSLYRSNAIRRGSSSPSRPGSRSPNRVETNPSRTHSAVAVGPPRRHSSGPDLRPPRGAHRLDLGPGSQSSAPGPAPTHDPTSFNSRFAALNLNPRSRVDWISDTFPGAGGVQRDWIDLVLLILSFNLSPSQQQQILSVARLLRSPGSREEQERDWDRMTAFLRGIGVSQGQREHALGLARRLVLPPGRPRGPAATQEQAQPHAGGGGQPPPSSSRFSAQAYSAARPQTPASTSSSESPRGRSPRGSRFTEGEAYTASPHTATSAPSPGASSGAGDRSIGIGNITRAVGNAIRSLSRSHDRGEGGQKLTKKDSRGSDKSRKL